MDMEMPMQAPAHAGGMLDTVKAKLDVDQFVENFDMRQVGLYAGVGFSGFLAGFLLKKYSQYLVFALALIGGLFALQYFGYIAPLQINWVAIQQQLGMQPVAMETMSMAGMWEWVRSNFAFVLSGSVGFLVGLKLG